MTGVSVSHGADAAISGIAGLTHIAIAGAWIFLFTILRMEEAEEKYGLHILTAWTFAEDDRLKYQNDHAGANETSIVMAVRPELVDFGQVKEDESNLIGIAGRHPVRESSAAYGNELSFSIQ